MRYLRVEWLLPHPDDPVTLYTEVDDAGREVRKVDVFADGRIGFAGPGGETPSTGTWLGEQRVPSLEEIASDPQFKAAEITKEEFDKVWASRFCPMSN